MSFMASLDRGISSQGNLVEYGRLRDEKLVDLINEGTAFTRRQLQDLFFDFPSGRRKSLERLSKLVKAERIKQWQRDDTKPSIYHTLGRRPKNIDHCLSINEVYVAFMKQKQSHQIIEWEWHYSIMDETIVADSFINLYLQPDRQGRKVVMLEVECDPRKKFDKPEGYTKVYDMNWNIPLNFREYKKNPSIVVPKMLPWVVWDKVKGSVFPTVLIVTDKDIEIPPERNPHGIDFKIVTMEQVKKDVFSLIR